MFVPYRQERTLSLYSGGVPPTTDKSPAKRSEARERLLSTASDLFYSEGINGVGVDRIDYTKGILERFRGIHARGSVHRWLEEWERIIDQGPESVMRTLTANTPQAADLRQNSPFPGVLSEAERRAVLEAFSRYWARRAA